MKIRFAQVAQLSALTLVLLSITVPEKTLEQIPPEAANKTPLANWWLTHAGLWMAILATLWTIALLALTNRRVARAEI